MSLEERTMIRGEITRIQRLTEIRLGVLLGFAGIAARTWREWETRKDEPTKHNNNIPSAYYLTPDEDVAIAGYYAANNNGGLKGYRVICYEMMDRNVAYVSPSSVYNVITRHKLWQKWAVSENAEERKKGFDQPMAIHEHWHIDFSYIKIGGAFYYFVSILDGYSRRILNWRLCETMETINVQVLVTEAKELYPDAVNPRIITDNGSQFISKDFAELVAYLHIGHTFTSVNHPQSNGKLERFHRTFKDEHVRRSAYLGAEDARTQMSFWICYYNSERLHSAIFYLTPDDVFFGRKESRIAERRQKLYDANIKRRAYWQNILCQQPAPSN